MIKVFKSPLFLLFFVVALLLAACGGSAETALDRERTIAEIEAEAGAITEVECPLQVFNEVEGETYRCGVYTAPVDYANPQGNTINLSYVVLHAENENATEAPIVYLSGGPGQSGLVAAGDSLYGDLRQERDLIFPAQRGTLFSERLALEECVNFLSEQIGDDELNAFVDSVSAQAKPDPSLTYDDYLAQYSEMAGAINGRCHEAFTNAGYDPTHFTTANSAQDIVNLVEALGHDSFNLHGTSYGTRLALEIIRRHPEANIRSVVLDSPSAPTSDRLKGLASATHDMVLRLFADCAADTACNEAYPNLTERTNALLAQIAKKPIAVDDQVIGPDELIIQLSDLSNTRANYIPRLIAELEAGETETYQALLTQEVGSSSPKGSQTSPTIDNLMKTISAAGTTPDDPYAGLKIVGEILPAVLEENPYEAMKAVAQEQLADADTLPQVLEGIDALTANDINTLSAMYSVPTMEIDEDEANLRTDAISKNNAQFLLTGISCSEQTAFEDVEVAVNGRDTLAIPALAASDKFLAIEVGNCTDYPMGELDPTYHQPVSSDIPILILQGEFDVRTPLQNGLDLADQLNNATLVVVPQAGHETWTTALNCVGEISISFLQNLDQAPDLSCLDQRQERFVLPDEALTDSNE